MPEWIYIIIILVIVIVIGIISGIRNANHSYTIGSGMFKDRYDNINKDIYDINGKKHVFDLPNSTKNQKTKLNNSCFFENMMELGEPHEIHRSKTAFIGACFACDLGFGVSITGYSPMTFSPYDHVTKREECRVLPESVVFEQYTRHKKSKFYKP